MDRGRAAQSRGHARCERRVEAKEGERVATAVQGAEARDSVLPAPQHRNKLVWGENCGARGRVTPHRGARGRRFAPTAAWAAGLMS